MGFSSALSNALSGLNASSRAAELVSSNLSNIMTEGYGRREIALGARGQGTGGGVQILGVSRRMDQTLVTDRRGAEAGLGQSQTTLQFYTRLENKVGSPDDPASLAAKLADFEANLVTAASRPDSETRLQTVVTSAKSLASTITNIADHIQSSRNSADQNIATQVSQLNTALGQVRDLNVRISGAINQGNDTSALMDQRQTVIDTINKIVPVQEVSRDRGTVALFTKGGAIILDGTVAEIGFTPNNAVMPHMTLENGMLSGLTLNGRPINSSGDQSPLAGGTLGAEFTVRDTLAPSAQTELDAVTRDLIERFQSSALDPTIPPGGAGLFTDQGVAFNAVDEIGISTRLALNSAVDPATGGTLTRLRDGLNAATVGPASGGTLLNGYLSALSARNTMSSPVFGISARSAGDNAAAFLSGIGAARVTHEQLKAFDAAQTNELKSSELQNGVDSDEELQNLMLIERAYAANAKMVQVVDELMQTLLRI